MPPSRRRWRSPSIAVSRCTRWKRPKRWPNGTKQSPPRSRRTTILKMRRCWKKKSPTPRSRLRLRDQRRKFPPSMRKAADAAGAGGDAADAMVAARTRSRTIMKRWQRRQANMPQAKLASCRRMNSPKRPAKTAPATATSRSAMAGGDGDAAAAAAGAIVRNGSAKLRLWRRGTIPTSLMSRRRRRLKSSPERRRPKRNSATAVADLDAAPPFAAAAPSSEPAVVESTPSAPASQPEPPRRRSTVREPAPIVSADAPQPTPVPASSPPPPEPVITEVGESESTDKPRRSGWWSRRFAGG